MIRPTLLVFLAALTGCGVLTDGVPDGEAIAHASKRQQQALSAQQFQSLDKDQNQRLSLSEFSDGLLDAISDNLDELARRLLQPKLAEMFAQVDQNHDQQVDLTEFNLLPVSADLGSLLDPMRTSPGYANGLLQRLLVRLNRSQSRDEAEYLFQRFDQDHNGLLERPEFKRAFLAHLPTPPAPFAQFLLEGKLGDLFRALDRSNDLTITPDEFAAWHIFHLFPVAQPEEAVALTPWATRWSLKREIAEAFRQSDTQSDQTLSWEEFQTAAQRLSAPRKDPFQGALWREHFQAFDADHNQRWNLSEFSAWYVLR